jgi:imidazolonepropionase-like amidohydrolase
MARVALRADTAFDGERVLPDGAMVLVDDGVIVGVEPASVPAPDGYEVRYRPGTTLLPGFIDAHSHLCGNGALDALDRLPGLDPGALDAAVDAALAAQLAAGVTAVRDLGDQAWAVVERRGRGSGLTVLASGPPITSVDGHCAAMGGEAKGADELRRAVRERADRGADVVKIMASGGAMTPHTDIRAAQFTVDELRAVVEEAHRHGLPVVAHAHAVAAVEQCVAARVDGIEHCSCIGPDGPATPPALAAALAELGTIVCPTLGYRFDGLPPEIAAFVAEAAQRTGFSLADCMTQVSDLIRAGVTVVSGSDSGINPVKPHGVLPEAIIELVQCGLSPSAALASATGAAADALGLSGRTGRLRPGLRADLLIVAGDATTDVTAIRDVITVLCSGRAAGRVD